MAKLQLSFACGLYDRMQPLYTGEVRPDGIDLNFIAIDQPRPIFDRMSGGQEFDVAEYSSSEFTQRFANRECPFVAIPVFPSIAFRLGFIAVNRRSGIKKPKDLEGKSLDDVDDSEFAEVVRQRNAAARARAPLAGGAETGAGPIHWFENYDAKNSRAWLLVDPKDGRIPPPTPESQKRAADRAAARAGHGAGDSYEYHSLYDQCITRGLPGSMMPAIYGNSYEIHQGQGFVAIRYEMIHETRIIPLDGRAHVSSKIPTYMGDARGHFEGNTLVVETTNFRDPNRGASEKLRLIEHFKPVAANKVEWAVTYDDQSTWARPWTYAMNLTKDPTQAPFEYACHEGNYGLANMLSASRADEKAGK